MNIFLVLLLIATYILQAVLFFYWNIKEQKTAELIDFNTKILREYIRILEGLMKIVQEPTKKK